ncbi:MAG: nuclear transport factor 2 family protein [Trueperaceae bacterium]
MKKETRRLTPLVLLFTGAILLLVLVACDAKAETEVAVDDAGILTVTNCNPGLTSYDPFLEKQNLNVMNAYLEALTSGQPFDRALYWDTNATLDIPASLPYGGTYTFSQFGDYEAKLFSTWQLSQDLPEPQLFASCDKVFLSGVWGATAIATGETVNEPLLEIFTLKNGKIVNDTFFFFDLKVVLDALE